MDLLSLPYDVRYMIYSRVFPPRPQIYLQAVGSRLRSITPEHKISTGLLRVNKLIHAEASEYLYRSYLFNIIGTKPDCLSSYRPFLKTTKKRSRQTVRIDAFSNGIHSATACLSIQAGTGRLALMKRRERGEPIDIDQLEREVRMKATSFNTSSRFWPYLSPSLRRHVQIVMAVCAALLAMVAALLCAY